MKTSQTKQMERDWGRDLRLWLHQLYWTTERTVCWMLTQALFWLANLEPGQPGDEELIPLPRQRKGPRQRKRSRQMKSEQTKQIKGPGGLILILDRSQVFPDDPGAGTPAMVEKGHYCATFWCAIGEAELLGPTGETYGLSPEQQAWLDQQQETVENFLKT